jgi:hypothetical protein
MADEKITQEQEELKDPYDKAIEEETGLDLSKPPKEVPAEKEDEKIEEQSEEKQSEEKSEEESEKKEEVVDDFDLKKVDLNIKWNGEEKPFYDSIKNVVKFIQENPDDPTAKEIITNIQKGFDYTQIKSKEKEALTQIAREKQSIEITKWENLANEIGIPPMEAMLNPMQEEPMKVVKDEKSGVEFIVYNNEVDLMNHKIQKEQWQNKYNTYVSQKQTARTENNLMYEEFTKNHPEVKLEDVMSEASKYINPSASKELVPFPKDTLEIFYKGKNFDNLVKAEVDKALTKQLAEWDSAGKKKTPKVAGAKVQPKEDEEKDDYDKAFEDYQNGKLTI